MGYWNWFLEPPQHVSLRQWLLHCCFPGPTIRCAIQFARMVLSQPLCKKHGEEEEGKKEKKLERKKKKQEKKMRKQKKGEVNNEISNYLYCNCIDQPIEIVDRQIQDDMMRSSRDLLLALRHFLGRIARCWGFFWVFVGTKWVRSGYQLGFFLFFLSHSQE